MKKYIRLEYAHTGDSEQMGKLMRSVCDSGMPNRHMLHSCDNYTVVALHGSTTTREELEGDKDVLMAIVRACEVHGIGDVDLVKTADYTIKGRPWQDFVMESVYHQGDLYDPEESYPRELRRLVGDQMYDDTFHELVVDIADDADPSCNDFFIEVHRLQIGFDFAGMVKYVFGCSRRERKSRRVIKTL